MSTDRRAFLKTTGALLLAPTFGLGACARPLFTAYPFTLGVASGAPLPTGVVLWTRLAPDPLLGGGIEAGSIPVRWEVAQDESFRKVVRHGVVDAVPQYAHSVHVEVDGLEPDRWYWYRFRVAGADSPRGRTRTAPAAGATTELRFAFASCQQYEQGYYAAHRHMAREDLDFVLFLGDYTYESSWGRQHVRKHETTSEPYTLEQYRNRYARYKSDPDLQQCHARCPWIVTWDDHEVQNDYADDRSEDLDPNFLARRAAAYQAYYEHMPLRATARPNGSALRLYGAHDFGDLLRVHVLDDRQYRSHQACPRPNRGGSNVVENCDERLDEHRSMLGAEQEQWLAASLAGSCARWNVIAQQTIMAQVDRRPGDNQKFWNDGWDGYPAARRRLLNAASRATNPIVVGGDVHCTWVSDLKTDFDQPEAPVIATEFVTTSISSQGPSQKEVAAVLAENPHLKFGRGDRRGYTMVELEPDAARVRLRMLRSEKDPDSTISTAATFVVHNGRPGAEAD